MQTVGDIVKRFPWFRTKTRAQSHSVRDYRALVRSKLREMPENPSLALAQAVGAPTMEDFALQGDAQVAALHHHGLQNGATIYDLGCGCGRTAQALRRSGWQGNYIGVDIVPELLKELARHCPGYVTKLHSALSISANDSSLDIIFHWSVFTHLYPGEAFLYTADAFRALKPGGKMLFSFLEMEEPEHRRIWEAGLNHLRKGNAPEHLDVFLHRDWIRQFASDAGFAEPRFTDGLDSSAHPALWQSIAVLEKA